MRWFVFLLGAAVTTSGAATLRQAAVEVTPKPIQLRQLEWQKAVLSAMADSMPESLYRDKVTPEQRDFAQQLVHAAEFPLIICAGILEREQRPQVDTITVLNSASGMKGFISETFTLCEGALRDWTEEDRAAEVMGFGGVEVPKADFLDQVFLHSAYTLGQVVANFRKRGMAPPEFPSL